jgi:hypothetical protein
VLFDLEDGRRALLYQTLRQGVLESVPDSAKLKSNILLIYGVLNDAYSSLVFPTIGKLVNTLCRDGSGRGLTGNFPNLQ